MFMFELEVKWFSWVDDSCRWQVAGCGVWYIFGCYSSRFTHRIYRYCYEIASVRDVICNWFYMIVVRRCLCSIFILLYAEWTAVFFDQFYQSSPALILL